ncbi:MAG TPA: superoxide dismutase [Anaerovoracaceae bacterium]|nr:superoxide dismutase [Anaerovoracaceae bacterium]
MECIMVPTGQHQLPPLPYDYCSLEPVISEKTLKLHHDIHHKAYVDGLNLAENSLAESRKRQDFQFLKYWANELAFNGSGNILHSIYWTVMAPLKMGGEPGPHTLYYIGCYFGSFNAFKNQFKNAAAKVEGSGWSILTWQPTWNRMEILQAEKHQNLTQWSGIPILVCDVWEHAYYLDYQNERQKYIDSWWQLINWYEVERRLLLAVNGRVPLTLMQE